MQTFDFQTFEHLFPDITRTPYSDQVKLQTLAEIGLANSESAIKEGYVCIKQSISKRRQKSPSLWLQSDRIATLESVAMSIKADRVESDRIKAEQTRIAHERKLALIQEQRAELRSGIEATIAELSQEVWDKAALDLQIENVLKEGVALNFAMVQLFSNLVHHLNMSEYLKPPKDIHSSNALLRGVLATSFGPGYLNIPVPVTAIWPSLLSNDSESIKRMFDEMVPAYEARAAKHLADVPAWLPKENVIAWAVRYCISEGTPAPYVQYIIDNMGHPNLEAAGFTIRKNSKVELEVKVPFKHPRKGEVSITVILDKNQVCSSLSHIVSAVSFADAVDHVRKKTVDRYYSLVDKAAETIVSHMPEAAYSGLIERDQLVEAAKSEIFVILRGNPKAFTNNTDVVALVKPALLTKCEEVKSYKIAEQCRRALPSRLADFYPVARSLNRKLVLVIGPTNSAKTYKALERFMTTDSGAYLAPLRLLALEVRDTLVEKGLPVSLVTGELIEVCDGAKHCSSTIEMMDYANPVDMAIIDETQMLSDSDRGSAWLQAVIGAPAREVWLLGAKESRNAVIALAEYLGEPLEIIETERLTPLEVSKDATRLEDIPKQGALIAFSRQDVLFLAGELREKYNRRPAVVYGALSPEVRRDQARRFRSGEADCIVATDAIGMGLNLPISSIVFSTNMKYNGQCEEEITDALVHQIAGRAGRYGIYESGIVSAIDKYTLASIKSTLSQRPANIPNHFTYGPSWPVVKLLSEYLDTDKMATILEFFTDKLTLPDSNLFTPGVDDDRKIVARVLDRMRLTLHERHSFLGAPVPIYKGVPNDCLVEFAGAIERKAPLCIDSLKRYHCGSSSHDHMVAENAVKVLTLYCWLFYRYPDQFPDRLPVMEEIKKLNVVIARYLSKSKPRCCPECGEKIKWNHKFRICEPCFKSQRNARRFGHGFDEVDDD